MCVLRVLIVLILLPPTFLRVPETPPPPLARETPRETPVDEDASNGTTTCAGNDAPVAVENAKTEEDDNAYGKRLPPPGASL